MDKMEYQIKQGIDKEINNLEHKLKSAANDIFEWDAHILRLEEQLRYKGYRISEIEGKNIFRIKDCVPILTHYYEEKEKAVNKFELIKEELIELKKQKDIKELNDQETDYVLD